MKKIIIGFLGLAMLIAGTVFVFAQTSEKPEDRFGGPDKMRKGGHRGSKHGGSGFMFRGLDLTDEQKAQLKEIHDGNEAKLAPVFEALKANREKMDAATANGAFDEATVTAIANEQAALSAQLIVEKERVKSQSFAILTPEQKAKFEERKAKYAERFNREKPQAPSEARE